MIPTELRLWSRSYKGSIGEILFRLSSLHHNLFIVEMSVKRENQASTRTSVCAFISSIKRMWALYLLIKPQTIWKAIHLIQSPSKFFSFSSSSPFDIKIRDDGIVSNIKNHLMISRSFFFLLFTFFLLPFIDLDGKLKGGLSCGDFHSQRAVVRLALALCCARTKAKLKPNSCRWTKKKGGERVIVSRKTCLIAGKLLIQKLLFRLFNFVRKPRRLKLVLD